MFWITLLATAGAADIQPPNTLPPKKMLKWVPKHLGCDAKTVSYAYEQSEDMGQYGFHCMVRHRLW